MADEGIDQIVDKSVIFQVKWTSKFLQNPETWLDKAIAGERDKIRRLVCQKRISRYVLMTSVAGTTTAQRTGSIQKLQMKLDAYSTEFGIPIECWWQSDVDAAVDAAPDAIKWTYQEMLAGSEAVRYLIHGSSVEGQAARMRDTLIHVMAVQWREDMKVKFSQVDMNHNNIADLYVDVQVSLQSPPNNAYAEYFSKTIHSQLEELGAVSYLLRTEVPLTYLLGVPGQGKSTLGQYLSQVHRAALLPEAKRGSHPPLLEEASEPKLPIRIDIKDYATWLSGDDPYGDEDPPPQLRLRKKSERSLELFIAHFCRFHSGGRQVLVEDVQSFLERYPTLLVLDGLDEVADPNLRSIVVEQINLLSARMGQDSNLRRFQVLVTSRPNASNLPEPDKGYFQTLNLKPLSPSLQRQFLNKWCEVNQIYGTSRRNLRRTFENRTGHEHVAQLADNPMQLTILLFLINKRGEAVPLARTPLYRDYLETLLDREVNRDQITRDQVPDVKEVTAFLGWHMHSGVESTPAAGRMPRRDIEMTLQIYFQQTDRPFDSVESLFKAASDRFWALTSKVEGTFEFAVQPLREYFAANFLAEWAGRDRISPLAKQEVLRHLIDRSYWLNTARFYAGFASPNELASLRYGLEEVVDGGRHPLQERTAVWILLSDGLFAGNRAVQRDVVALLTSDLSVVLIGNTPDTIANFPKLTQRSCADEITDKLFDQIQTDPLSPLNMSRAAILREKAGVGTDTFLTWWRENFRAATCLESRTAWLEVAGRFGVPRLLSDDLEDLTIDGVASCRAAIGANASPAPGSDLDSGLMNGVLAGWCSDVPTTSTSEAGALLRAMRPQWFQGVPACPQEQSLGVPDHLWPCAADRAARTAAWRTLVAIDARYEKLRRACGPGKGRGGTTERWQKPAMIIKEIHGPTWLAAEIAVSGAANRSVVRSGSFEKGGEPFGVDVDYGTFVMAVHQKPDTLWWSSTFDCYADNLSRGMWALALIATASTEIVESQLNSLESALAQLSEDEFECVQSSSSRLGRIEGRRRLDDSVWAHTNALSDRALLLITHFATDLIGPDLLEPIPDTRLANLATPTAASWPIARALTGRMSTGPNATIMQGLRKLVCRVAKIKGEPAEWHTAILEDPGSFPASWVLEAERTRSSANVELPLDDLAFDLNWKPSVPRFPTKR